MDGGVSLLMDVDDVCLFALRLACLCLDAKDKALPYHDFIFILKEPWKTERCWQC